MPKSIGDILLGGGGHTKTASAQQGQPSREELEKAAAMASASVTLDTLTKEATDKLAGDMAYLGYCFGWGLNKAAMEFQEQVKQADGLGSANIGSNEAKGPAGGVGDPTSKELNSAGPGALATNDNLKGSGHPQLAGALSKMIQARKAVGVSTEGSSMNAGEQKQGSEREQLGANFRQILLQKLSQKA